MPEPHKATEARFEKSFGLSKAALVGRCANHGQTVSKNIAKIVREISCYKDARSAAPWNPTGFQLPLVVGSGPSVPWLVPRVDPRDAKTDVGDSFVHKDSPTERVEGADVLATTGGDGAHDEVITQV